MLISQAYAFQCKAIDSLGKLEIEHMRPRPNQKCHLPLLHAYVRAAPCMQGLRLHDNPALLEALTGAEHMYPVFVLDPYFLQQGTYKWVCWHRQLGTSMQEHDKQT